MDSSENSSAKIAEALQHCANEPIQHPGSIQPHGALIALDPEFRIVLASANAVAFFSLDHYTLINLPLSELIGKDNAQTLAEQIGQRLVSRSSKTPQMLSQPVWVVSGGQRLILSVQVHVADGLFIAEFTNSSETSSNDVFVEMMRPVRQALAEIDHVDNVAQYVQPVVEKIRGITGYDRVMMYRFDSNWDGEVIAESRLAGLDSYQGLHFPASDIPPQARSLYARNNFRILADTEAQPCPVLPVDNPVTGKPIDLGFAVLRSFSPVHVQYLRNMGVRASMSISILQNGKLWGLIACHHSQPKYLQSQIRAVAEYIGQSVSDRLSSLENDERLTYLKRVQELTTQVVRRGLSRNQPPQEVTQTLSNELLGIMDACGCIIRIEHHQYAMGKVPPDDKLEFLLEWLRHQPVGEVFHTDSLPHLLPAMQAHAATASGLLAAPVTRDMRECVIWFRPEQVSSVIWAGAPQMPRLNEHNEYRLDPRKSFASWQESRQGRSRSWEDFEVCEAHNIALNLIVALSLV